MHLYRIWQTKNRGYDTYDSAVVCAESEDDARSIHPSEEGDMDAETGKPFSLWTTRDNVQVEWLGPAASWVRRGVIVASFNAG